MDALDELGFAGTTNDLTVSAVARPVSSPSCEPSCDGDTKPWMYGRSTDASSATTAGTSYEAVSYTWTTNPATGQPWTSAEVNALQAGVKLDSTNWIVQVTQAYVTVDVGATTTTTYVYADAPTGMNTLTSNTRAGVTTTYTYDANGNLDTKTGGWDYDWNAENLMTVAKLSAVPQQSYTYDGLGRRVNVTGLSSTWTVSIVAGMDVIYEKDQAGSVTRYVYANGMRIAKITSAGVQYYLADHLGSTRKVLDASRNTVFSTDYEPFGKPYAVAGTEAFKYTMEKHDDPTGLVYLRARQYDPEIGRFVSADPVLGSLSRPQTSNRYAYVSNNPLKFIDPSGEFLQILGGAIVGGLIGYGLCVWATGGWTSRQCGAAGLLGMAVGAFAGATFGLGMAAFGVGEVGGIAVGSWAAVGAGVASGAAAGAQTYFFASELAMGTGMMSPQDLSMEDFALSVGLGAAFGGIGGKYYNPDTYWGGPKAPGKKPIDFTRSGLDEALDHRLPGGVSREQFISAARRAANEPLSVRTPSTLGRPGYRAYGPINDQYGVVVVIVDNNIVNAWPIRLVRIARYLA